MLTTYRTRLRILRILETAIILIENISKNCFILGLIERRAGVHPGLWFLSKSVMDQIKTGRLSFPLAKPRRRQWVLSVSPRRSTEVSSPRGVIARTFIPWALCGLVLAGLFHPAPAFAATYGQKVVAAVLMGEAWGEGEKAMIAVAEVIRTRADQLNLSPLAIVKQPYQFSCLNHTTPEKLLAKFQHQKDFQVALRIARLMYNEPEKLPGYARDATHFENVGNGSDWACGQKPVARVGKLAFYRLSS